jgi:hypothetical protein
MSDQITYPNPYHKKLSKIAPQIAPFKNKKAI